MLVQVYSLLLLTCVGCSHTDCSNAYAANILWLSRQLQAGLAFLQHTVGCMPNLEAVRATSMTVYYACSGEMLVACCDSEAEPSHFCIKPCAVKQMSYSSVMDRQHTNAELAGMRAAQGLPYLMQSLACFDQVCAQTGQRTLYIVTE